MVELDSSVPIHSSEVNNLKPNKSTFDNTLDDSSRILVAISVLCSKIPSVGNTKDTSFR